MINELIENRKGRIGGTDIAAIMGVSPYKSKRELWLEMTGQVTPKDINYEPHVVKGRVFESIARDEIERTTGLKFPPVFVKHPEVPYFGGSVDGLSETNVLLEIKTTGKEAFKNAQLTGEIPAHHFFQMQWYMMCVGASECIYYIYNSEEENHRIDVQANKDVWAEMVVAAHKFWACVQNKVEPDEYLISDDMRHYISQWGVAKSMFDEAERRFKEVDDHLKKLFKEAFISHLEWKDIKVQTVERKGNVQYAKIPELKEVDLEKYRGAPIKYYKISGGQNELEE